MIFLISPSKTMKPHPCTTDYSTPMFKKESQVLLQVIQQFDIEQLMTLFACSKAIATDNYHRFQRFEEVHTAIYSYTGQVYQGIHKVPLNSDQIHFLQKHLYIVSGLYGLVRPLDVIGLYRLPMDLTLKEKELCCYWKPYLKPILQHHQLVNLCSDEYYAAFKDESLDIINVEFLTKEQRTPHSMKLKSLRGQMIQLVAINRVDDVESLQLVQVENYVYDEVLSSRQKLVYKEQSRSL
jgi:cytoplasmic iron level regulating protein YaaA (DUF328/UPF0246 family)